MLAPTDLQSVGYYIPDDCKSAGASEASFKVDMCKVNIYR